MQASWLQNLRKSNYLNHKEACNPRSRASLKKQVHYTDAVNPVTQPKIPLNNTPIPCTFANIKGR